MVIAPEKEGGNGFLGALLSPQSGESESKGELERERELLQKRRQRNKSLDQVMAQVANVVSGLKGRVLQ